MRERVSRYGVTFAKSKDALTTLSIMPTPTTIDSVLAAGAAAISRPQISRRRWLQTTGAIGLAAMSGSSGLVARERSEDGAALDIGSRRELFVDDALIEKLSGEASLELNRPVPREIAIVHDAAWEGSGSGYHTVFQDGDRYRMYYRGLHLDVAQSKLDTSRHAPFYCYAESSDGVHWEKPELGIVEFEGSKQNNIVLEGLGTHNFTPFKDTNPDCPPESRYKALGGVKREGGLFAFHSGDGVHWTLKRKEPVITRGAFDSQNLAFWDPVAKRYRAYWRTFTAGVTTQKKWKPAGFRAVRTGLSNDFLSWTDQSDLSYFDSPAEHLYTNQVKSYARAPHLLIGFPTRYVDRGWTASTESLPDVENRRLRASSNRRYGTAVTEGLLMASRDGVNFKRWNEAFLRPGIGRAGTWQYGQNYIAWHVVETAASLPGAPRELSLYSTEGYWHGKGGKLRRYTLRLDGFVSLRASSKGGALVTKPLTFSGSRLSINFATSAAGSLRVEIQDPSGKPLPGFALSDCPEHFGDTIDRTVTFKGGADVSKLAGQPLRLVFHLNDADLYSFRIDA